MRVERMLLLLFPAACCAAGELLAPLPPDGSLDDCGVSVGWLTLGDWLILGAVPTMQVRLAVDLSSSPYRLGRDVLVEMQARDAAGTNAPLAKGAAWLQQEERCASDASLPGCSSFFEIPPPENQNPQRSHEGSRRSGPKDHAHASPCR